MKALRAEGLSLRQIEARMKAEGIKLSHVAINRLLGDVERGPRPTAAEERREANELMKALRANGLSVVAVVERMKAAA